MFCGSVTTRGYRVPNRMKGFVCEECYQRWAQEVSAFVGSARSAMPIAADCGCSA
jgi:hypothetical protein